MPLSVDIICSHPSFLPSLAYYGEALADVYHTNQRLGANLASQRRWLISQTALALYWGDGGGLTVNRLIEVLAPFRIASPNTIRAFINESVQYGFLNIDPDSRSIRPRYWRPTEVVSTALMEWVALNLTMLDRIDGKNRVSMLMQRPDLVFSVQPRLAWNCLNDPAWRQPPPRVALLQNTISGGMVMDHIVSQIGAGAPQDERYLIPPINARRLSEQIFISRTHLQRILSKAGETGVLGWSRLPFESEMWIDKLFIDEYCRWQAVKSHHIDEAFEFLT
ncbi:hypothetical protein [Martelella soudanensis]|uniref:hypothetical protein n=1 Tax=unclassified Martelella TaxID=2629616 RepID=UPI0015DF2154|nr:MULTISPECIES: hypothetical protein [unclassified Martelella]